MSMNSAEHMAPSVHHFAFCSVIQWRRRDSFARGTPVAVWLAIASLLRRVTWLGLEEDPARG
jgi:hypothetical protein